MGRVYFDITDVIQFAGRSTRLTGIQRVVFNIVNLLAQKHGGDSIRCIYFDRTRQAMIEVDLSTRPPDPEFDAESVLADLGLAGKPGFFPSKVRLKSYLRNHSRSKIERAWLKLRIYLWVFVARDHLRKLELLSTTRRAVTRLVTRPVDALPGDARLVHLGSSWFFPEIWSFSLEHRRQGGEVVQFVHDLIPLTHPQYMAAKEPPVFAAWLEAACNYATRLVCNSRYTAQTLHAYADTHGQALDASVVLLAHEFIGYARNSEPPLPERMQGLAGRQFVLCVGTIEERKNGRSLLVAWQRMARDRASDLPLLIFAGRYGKIGGGEFREVLESMTVDVRVLDMPSDHELAWLYRNCLFTVYPSHVEGWGLPVGESAWFGRYCLASNASSIPEVCGPLLDYFEPNDQQALESALSRVLANPELLREKERAIAGAHLRTWEEVADNLYASVRQ